MINEAEIGVDLSIRPSQDEELQVVAEMVRLSIEQLCAEVYTPPQLQSIVAANHPYYIPGLATVAQLGDEIVGYGVILGDDIQALYVHPNYIRRGIGRRLLARLETQALARRIQHLHVNASLNARPFYQACGFHTVLNRQIVPQGTVPVPVVKMVKALPSDRLEPSVWRALLRTWGFLKDG
jgi:putative acetyltransferase